MYVGDVYMCMCVSVYVYVYVYVYIYVCVSICTITEYNRFPQQWGIYNQQW